MYSFSPGEPNFNEKLYRGSVCVCGGGGGGVGVGGCV